MKICFVGLDNLPVLAPEYRQDTLGGESVQQTLLAHAMARQGHEVSMVVADHGQDDGVYWGPIRTYKAYRPDAGLPVLRFIHPRWTGLWSALARADADLYYTSCAGMHVGLLALFCQQAHKRFVFRCASDSDCDGSQLLVRFARDRWLYALGLRRAHAILAQSARQVRLLARNYGLPARAAAMLVEEPEPTSARDIDVLWVANIRQVKRPDRILGIADHLPQYRFHLVGGALPGEESLFRAVRAAAATRPNVVFHGRLPYRDANGLYRRARLLLNTSDIEGFPNVYLQAWAHGVPVVTMFDPDHVIQREGLGVVVTDPAAFATVVRRALGSEEARCATGRRCREFMRREYAEEKVLRVYCETFEEVQRGGTAARAALAVAGEAPHA